MTTPESITPGKAFHRVLSETSRASGAYRMMEAGDRILIALSGGRDSFVLLEALREIAKRVPFELSLEAVTFDPGYPDFHASAIGGYCQTVGVPHSMIRLDVPALLASSPEGERRRRPCVWCSRMRRGKLYGFAREHHFNKLALGHHADDLLASFWISLVRGAGLTTMGPNVAADTERGETAELRIIRPLALVPEAVVKCAAQNFEFPEAGECPFQSELDAEGDRAWAKREIERLAQRIPDVRKLMLKSLGKVEAAWLLDRRYLSDTNQTSNNMAEMPEGTLL